MKEYLKNSICNFTPLFDIDYTKKQNILSASFFKIKTGAYKDFTIYVEGIKDIDKNILILKNFRLRLFIDYSIYEDEKLMKMLYSLKNTDLVLFSCPAFIEGNIYHRGLFSSLVRFFPLFNFPNNDANIFKTTDIDSLNGFKFEITGDKNLLFKPLKKNNANSFFLYSKGFFSKTIGITKINKKTIIYEYNLRKGFLTPYVYALNIGTFGKKYNYKYLEDALMDADYDKKFKKQFSFYHNSEKQKNIEWDYGIDEFFINVTLVDNLIKDKHPFFYIIKSLYFIENLYFFISVANDDNKEYKIFFETIFADDDNFKFNTVQESYKYLDDLFYKSRNKKNLSDKNYDIIYKIYSYYIAIYNTKKIKYYNKDFLDLILNNKILGKFYMNELLLNYKTKNTEIKYTLCSKLPDKYIIKLKKLKKELNVETTKLFL